MLGSRAEAEEIAQETFLRAHRALGEFRGEARLGTWLYAIASRLCLNRLAAGTAAPRARDESALAACRGRRRRRRRGAGARRAGRPRCTRRSPRCRRTGASSSCCATSRDWPTRRSPRSSGCSSNTVRSRLHRARHGPQGQAGAMAAMTCQETRELFSARVDDALAPPRSARAATRIWRRARSARASGSASSGRSASCARSSPRTGAGRLRRPRAGRAAPAVVPRAWRAGSSCRGR